MGSCLLAQVAPDLLLGPAFSVGAVRAEGIVDVYHREEPRRKRDLVAFQALRIAGSVPLFMVTVRDV